MKLIIFPLAFLVVVGFLNVLMYETSYSQTVYISGDPTFGGTSAGYYDSNDHLVQYINGTVADDYGNLTRTYVPWAADGPWSNAIVWKNSSGSYNVYDATGERVVTAETTNFDLFSGEGLIALVSVTIIAGAVIGMRLFGLGQGEESLSLIIKGGFFITIWAIFSVMAMSLITSIPLFIGPLIYFTLTIIYTLGIIGQVGSGGGSD